MSKVDDYDTDGVLEITGFRIRPQMIPDFDPGGGSDEDENSESDDG